MLVAKGIRGSCLDFWLMLEVEIRWIFFGFVVGLQILINPDQLI